MEGKNISSWRSLLWMDVSASAQFYPEKEMEILEAQKLSSRVVVLEVLTNLKNYI